MQRLILDLSRGLSRNSSELAEPFHITRLPLWPKPGKNWSSHPGHDVVPFPSEYDLPNATVLRSDIAGNIAFRKGGTITVASIAEGRSAETAASDGVFIPNLGWYYTRFQKAFLPGDGQPLNLVGVNQSLPEVVAGNLDAGNYILWALTFARTRSGLFLSWYSYYPVSLTANGGIKVRLSEEPGEQRVVQIYVQRQVGGSWGPLTFLAELSKGDTEFVYSKHTQEGAAVNFAIPRAKGLYAAGYNSRLFYQADKLTVLGASSKPSTETTLPSPELVGYGYASLGEMLFGAGASYSRVPINKRWDASVAVGNEIYASLRDGGKTYIIRLDTRSMAVSRVYESPTEVEYLAAATSNSRIVFVGKGGACLVGNRDSDIANPDSWSTPTVPAGDITDVVWTGTEFAAIASRTLLKGGNTGISWTAYAPPATLRPTYTEWRHLVYLNGRYYIYAVQPLSSGEWYHRIFWFDGSAWNESIVPHRVQIGPNTFTISDPDPVCRRFSMLSVDSGQLVVAHGVKGQTYPAGFATWVTPPESDWVIRVNPSGFTVALTQTYAMSGGSTPFGTSFADNYGRLVKLNRFTGDIVFVHTNGFRIIDTVPSSGFAYTQVNPAGFQQAIAAGSDESLYYIKNETTLTQYYVPLNISRDQALQPFSWYDEGALYLAGLSSGLFGQPELVYLNRLSLDFAARESANTGITRPNLITPWSHRVSGSSSVIVLASLIGNTLTIRTGSNLSSFAIAHTESGVLDYQVRARGSKGYCWFKTGSANKVGVYSGTSFNLVTVAQEVKGVVSDGTNEYIVGTNKVYNLSGTEVYTDTGTLVGGADGSSGTIHVVRSTGEVVQLNTSTWSGTSLGTITPAGTLTNAYGGMVGGVPPVLHVGIKDDGGWKLYVLSGGSFNLVLTRTYPITILTGASSSGSGGTGSESGEQDIVLPERTVVWTEPGYVNLATPFSFVSISPRASRKITEIVTHPAGVMVFLDNETYVMQGRFTSVEDTRVAPYPSTIGHDDGRRLAVVGSTIYVIWGGRVYALEGGEPVPISYDVDDGVAYVEVAYDHRNNMLVARRENGEVFRYDRIRRVWFNDMDNGGLIFETAEGVYYIRNGRIYSIKPENAEPTQDYYRIPQEVWIDAVKLQGEEIKRLRMLTLDMETKGPAMPTVAIYNEADVEVMSVNMRPTMQSSGVGLARYRSIFPPVVSYAPKRIKFTFGGARFDMAPVLEVAYEARKRKV